MPPPPASPGFAPSSSLPSLPSAVPPPTTRWSIIVAIRLLARSPLIQRIFAGVVLTQLLVQIIERSVLLSLFLGSSGNSDGALRSEVWFFCIVLITAACAAWNGLHALLTVNSAELVACFVTSLLLALRLVIDYANRSDDCSGTGAPVCASFLAVALALLAAGLGLAAAMYPDLRWRRYKAIGADVELRRIFARYEAFIALRSLDLQNAAIVLATGLVFFAGSPAREAALALGLAAALAVVEVAWELVGDAAARRESRPAALAFFALSAGTPAYIIWMAVVSLTDAGLFADVPASPAVRATIAAFGVFALVTRAATVVLAALLFADFGERYRGLRRLLEGAGADRLRRFDRSRVREWGSVRDASSGAGTPTAPPGIVGTAAAAAAAKPSREADDVEGAEMVAVVPTRNPFAAAVTSVS